MSTPDGKPAGDGPPGALTRSGEEAELALGATMAGLPRNPAAGGGSSAPQKAAIKPDAVTLPEPSRSSAALPKHIEETLDRAGHDKGPRQKVIEDELPRGASLGRYIVLACLGAGGMGVVYAAYDPELDRKVAIKLLRNDIVGGASSATPDASQARLRLLREAQAMARLQHPQVIAIYDVGTIKDQVFIAMEFIDGATLTGWLKEKPRSRGEILEVFTQAGRGLAAAHAVGLVHRDFKPDNVLVGKEGQVRVTDFGLARSVNQSDEYARVQGEPDSPLNQPLSVQLTRTGALMGTPRYMAPEQYSGGKTEPRTDQFSFCVALFEAIYEVPPFLGDTIATLGFNVVHGRVVSPPPDARVPTFMQRVLLRGLSVSPDDRFASMDELLTALNRERTSTPRLWIFSIAIVALALIGNLAYNLRKVDHESPCRGFESKLGGIWDAGRKAEIKTTLFSTARSYAADSWQRIERELDAYTQDWVTMRAQACMAKVRGEPSAMFELRRQCLDDRLQEVAAFTSILAKGEEGVVEHASIAVHELTPLALCADVEALRAPPPPPENPQERAQVDALKVRLAEVKAEQHFGRYGVALEQARTLAQQASTLKYPPIKADALFLLGEFEERVTARQAEKTFVRAAAAAMESRNQPLVAQTWIRLTALTGYRLNQPEKAESWAMLADAALDALSQADGQPLQVQLEVARCQVETGKRSYERAIELCQQALLLGSKLHGPGSAEVAEILHMIAKIYARQDDFDQAMRYYQQALEVEQAKLGPLHPNIASELRGIGLLLRDQRRYREAQDYLSQALTIVQKSLGPDHIRTSDFQLLVAINQMYQGKLGEAHRNFVRCFEIREKAGDSEFERRAEARYFLGQALSRLGRYNEALSLNQLGLELAERDSNRKEWRVAYNLHAIGVIMLALGRYSEAIPYLERALSIRQSQREEDRKASGNRLAETQFALAQALWNVGRLAFQKRALDLARNAQTNYTEWGNKPENELSAVTAWLAAPGPKKPSGLPALGFGNGATPDAPAAPASPSPPPMEALPPRAVTPPAAPTP